MADTRKRQDQDEPGDHGGEAAHRASSGAAAASAQATGDALRRSGAPGARAGEEGGRAASEPLRRTGEAGAEAVRRTGGAAAEPARRGTQAAVEAQQRFVEDAADRIKEAGQRLSQAVQQGAEDLRMLMPPLGVTGDGLREVQRTLEGLVEDTTRASLRVGQELFRLADPSPIVDLQRRFARECLGALLEGQAGLLRAARQTTEQALRPIERQIEQRRRGRQGADQGRRPLQEGRVADVMSREVRVASPEDTVQQAARAMREEDTGALPVGEGDRLVGMVTDRDLALRLVAEGKDPARTRVREVMTPEVRCVFEDEDLRRAAEAMAEQQVRRLPVVSRDRRLVGIVSLGDLATEGRAPRLAGRALAGVAREGGQHDRLAAE